MTRRGFLAIGGAAAALIAGRGGAFAAESFEITKTEQEWREILTDAQFRVLREEDTEKAFSSPLDTEKRAGTFHCAGCDLPLYSSKAKYDSGTGWPSFWEPLPNAIGTKADWGILGKRTEVHCRRCGGHLGHVFNDGPEPTGKRYCMNGLAMVFKPA
ncbi:MAG: peptide-methionine (R)-S-oxide reductase MsrB [Paracoccaceae bacterium]